LGRATLWWGGLSARLNALRWITGSASGSNLSGWATFIGIVFAFCVLWLTSRWALRHLMWRLRNRLMVAYIFIGVIPIVLLLLMAGVGSYWFASQFATYIAISNLPSQLQRLVAANDAVARQLNILGSSGRLNQQIAGELTAVSDQKFPQRTVTVWRGQKFSRSPREARSSALTQIQYLIRSRETSAVSSSIETACSYAR
jgi:hypothetical protein